MCYTFNHDNIYIVSYFYVGVYFLPLIFCLVPKKNDRVLFEILFRIITLTLFVMWYIWNKKMNWKMCLWYKQNIIWKKRGIQTKPRFFTYSRQLLHHLLMKKFLTYSSQLLHRCFVLSFFKQVIIIYVLHTMVPWSIESWDV